MTGAGPVLDLRHLSVHFETPGGELRVLRDVSLAIEPQETFGLAGESGSGFLLPDGIPSHFLGVVSVLAIGLIVVGR